MKSRLQTIEDGNSGSENNTNLQNVAIKTSTQKDHCVFGMKVFKPNLPSKIYHHRYNHIHKALPLLGLKNGEFKPGTLAKQATSRNEGQAKSFGKAGLSNGKNAQILNTLICTACPYSEILKTDPDSNQFHNNQSVPKKTKHTRTITQPTNLNEFFQKREIYSAKNSRAPRLNSNEIMMLAESHSHRRALVSQQKTRENHKTITKLSPKKERIALEELTFYKPSSKMRTIQPKPSQQNEFMYRHAYI